MTKITGDPSRDHPDHPSGHQDHLDPPPPSEHPLIDLSQTSLRGGPLAAETVRFSGEVLEYPTLALYHKLATALGRLLEVPPDRFSFGNGAAELIDAVTAASSYRDVVVLTPTFFLYERFAAKYGRNVHKLDWSWSAGLEQVHEVLSRTPALVWIVNPNNPTAHHPPAEPILELTAQHDCLVAIDESFADFAGASLASHAARTERLVVVRSFSKAFGLAGARVGYAVAGPGLGEPIDAQTDPLSTSRIGASLALRCVSGLLPQFQASWRDILSYLPAFVSLLGAAGIEVLSGPCNFVALRFQTHRDAARFHLAARNQGLILREGWHWEFSGDGGRLLRVSVPAGGGRAAAGERLEKVLAVFSG